MTFRKEDHQALQAMYAFKLVAKPDVAWLVPVLTRELAPGDGPADPEQAVGGRWSASPPDGAALRSRSGPERVGGDAGRRHPRVDRPTTGAGHRWRGPGAGLPRWWPTTSGAAETATSPGRAYSLATHGRDLAVLLDRLGSGVVLTVPLPRRHDRAPLRGGRIRPGSGGSSSSMEASTSGRSASTPLGPAIARLGTEFPRSTLSSSGCAGSRCSPDAGTTTRGLLPLRRRDAALRRRASEGARRRPSRRSCATSSASGSGPLHHRVRCLDPDPARP